MKKMSKFESVTAGLDRLKAHNAACGRAVAMQCSSGVLRVFCVPEEYVAPDGTQAVTLAGLTGRDLGALEAYGWQWSSVECAWTFNFER